MTIFRRKKWNRHGWISRTACGRYFFSSTLLATRLSGMINEFGKRVMVLELIFHRSEWRSRNTKRYHNRYVFFSPRLSIAISSCKCFVYLRRIFAWNPSSTIPNCPSFSCLSSLKIIRPNLLGNNTQVPWRTTTNTLLKRKRKKDRTSQTPKSKISP